MKKGARMVMWIGFVVGGLQAGSLTYDAPGYQARVSAYGYQGLLTIKPAPFDHMGDGMYVVHAHGDSYDLDSDYFWIVSDVGRSGNVITSLVENALLRVAFKSTFAPSNYFVQEVTIVNVTNFVLTNCVLYRIQDVDLYEYSENNYVGRDTATHALYQSEYGLFIAQNMYWPDLTPAERWYGGAVNALWDMMYDHPPSNGIAQASDTAVLHGIVIGDLAPGQQTTVVTRVSYGTSKDELSAHAWPVSFTPLVAGFAFSINTTAQNADSLGFTLLFDPNLAGITTLQNKLLSLYVNDVVLFDRAAGTVKVSPKGDSAVYQNGGITAVVKLSLAKNTAVMKVKGKGVALQPGLGAFVDGVSGAVYPRVWMYFNAAGQSGTGSAFVPYKAKPGKGFAGTQWK
ncbi:MAG: hypothetical protein N2595_08345 [bacterium]|nr:hypothetical protein [bacterium]